MASTSSQPKTGTGAVVCHGRLQLACEGAASRQQKGGSQIPSLEACTFPALIVWGDREGGSINFKAREGTGWVVWGWEGYEGVLPHFSS